MVQDKTIMFFKLVALGMAAMGAMFAWNVSSDHVLAAVMLPAAAAFGIAVLASD